MRAYLGLLENRRFRLLWTGSTVSTLGDGAAWVALAWTVYELEASASAVGALLVAYTAPVLLGGPLVGVVLDRVDRRRLLVADNLVRGAATAAVPLLYALGRLRLWAQTVRMRVIPAELRGRVFGTLRTLMQGTLPLGGAFAPLLVSLGGLRAAFASAVAVIAIPGLVGLVLPALADEARRGS